MNRETQSPRDFVKMSFAHIGVEIEFIGHGINEVAKVRQCLNDNYQLEIGMEILWVHNILNRQI